MGFWSDDEIKAARDKRAAEAKAEWIKEEIVEGGRDPDEVRQEANEIHWK